MSKRFEVKILERYCKGCRLCVEFCDQGKLYTLQKPNKQGYQVTAVRQDVECSGCMQCAVICPDAAVEIWQLEEVAVSETASE